MESSAAAPAQPPVPRPLYGDYAPADSTPIEAYKPLRGVARAAALMLGAVLLVDMAAVWSGLLELDLLQRIEAGVAVSDDEVNFNDSRQASIAVTQLVAYVMSAIVFIIWFHRAYRNVDAVAGPFARNHGTGWAIGGWFVPILSLWRPKQIANDIWRAGAPADTPRAREPGWLLRIWWLGFIVSMFLSRIATRGAGSEDTPAEFQASTKEFIASDAFDFFVAILAILVVRQTTRRMEAKAAAVREQKAAGPADAASAETAPTNGAGAGAGDAGATAADGREDAGGRASVAQPWTTPPTT